MKTPIHQNLEKLRVSKWATVFKAIAQESKGERERERAGTRKRERERQRERKREREREREIPCIYVC